MEELALTAIFLVASPLHGLPLKKESTPTLFWVVKLILLLTMHCWARSLNYNKNPNNHARHILGVLDFKQLQMGNIQFKISPITICAAQQ
jgi:hypothetical protein